MVMIKMTHNPLSEENLKILAKHIGQEWVANIQLYFERGGPEEAKWDMTQKPQKAAILKRIGEVGDGVTFQLLRKYFDENKKPLVGDQVLQNSFTFNVKTVNSVVTLEVGTNVDYARKHQFGEASDIPITETMKKGIKKLLKSRSKDKKKIMFLKAFLEKDTYHIQVRKRILIMWDTYMRNSVNALFLKYINDVNRMAK